jgi:hypothetical protein
MAREVARLLYILPAGRRYEVELSVGTLLRVTLGDLRSPYRMQFLCFRDLNCLPIFPGRMEWYRMVDIALTRSESVDLLRRLIDDAFRRAFRPVEPGEMEKYPLLSPPPRRQGLRFGAVIRQTGELNGVPRDIFRRSPRREPADA